MLTYYYEPQQKVTVVKNNNIPIYHGSPHESGNQDNYDVLHAPHCPDEKPLHNRLMPTFRAMDTCTIVAITSFDNAYDDGYQ